MTIKSFKCRLSQCCRKYRVFTTNPQFIYHNKLLLQLEALSNCDNFNVITMLKSWFKSSSSDIAKIISHLDPNKAHGHDMLSIHTFSAGKWQQNIRQDSTSQKIIHNSVKTYAILIK